MLRAGLIGLPSTGKTTLFRLLTRAGASPHPASGRIETSLGVAWVPDERLDKLRSLFPPRKRIPATVEFADLAGHGGPAALVDVAAFHEADALVHVVRAFRDPDVPHVHESIDPARDAQAMENELMLADLAVTQPAAFAKLASQAKEARASATA